MAGATGAPTPMDARRSRRPTTPETTRPGRSGSPGPRFRQSPFTVGFGFALGALLAFTLFQGAAKISGPLLTIVVAIFLAIGLDPVVSRLERRGMRRGFAIAIVFGGFALLVAGFVALIVPALVTQLSSLIDNLPTLFDQLRQNETIRNLDDKYQIVDKIQSSLTGRVDDIFSGSSGRAQVLAGVVFKILTITILTLYFLAAFHPMKATAYRLAPASRRAAHQHAHRRDPAAGGRLRDGPAGHQRARRGCAPTYICASPGVHFASALALLISLFSLIPMVGATIGSIIVSLVAATQSLTLGIATLIFFIVYQQFENYLIYPRVMRRAVNIHPAAALVGALIGGSLLGFVGAVIAVPVRGRRSS